MASRIVIFRRKKGTQSHLLEMGVPSEIWAETDGKSKVFFLDKYFLLVPLLHELFIAVRNLLESKQQTCIEQIAQILNLNYEDTKK